MSTFRAFDSFVLPNRGLLVLFGVVEDGPIEAGQYVHLPVGPGLDIIAKIDSVEPIHRNGERFTALLIDAQKHDGDFWAAMNIHDEVLRVDHP